MRAEQITDRVAHHGEGPCWWPQWGGLRWVDLAAGDVLSLGSDGRVGRTHVGTVVAALRPRADGGAIIALERAFALADGPDLSALHVLPEIWSDDRIRFNDGGCDPQGRFHCGTMAYDQSPGAGALFRISAEAGGRFETMEVLDSVTVSNGLGWSPDGTVAYYTDTPTGRIDMFDWSPQAGLLNRRPFVALGPDDQGSPDGLCVDAEGGVWTALYGGSQVRRYSAEGELDQVVELPVPQVTACTFGGEALDQLFITTSREHLSSDEQPAAGALFAVRPGVRGLAAIPFAG